MDFGDGNLLLEGWRGQEIFGDAGKQGFASAGWSRDKNIVVAGESNDESTLGEGLTVDLIEIITSVGRRFNIRFSNFYNIRGWRRRDWGDTLEMEDELEEGFDADNLDTREELGFGEIVCWDVDFGEAGGFGGFDDIDDAVNGANLAVQGKFADEELLFEVGNEEIPGKDKDG